MGVQKNVRTRQHLPFQTFVYRTVFQKKNERTSRGYLFFSFLILFTLMLTLKLRIKNEVEPLIIHRERKFSTIDNLYVYVFIVKNFHILSQIYLHNVRDIRKTCNFKVSYKTMKEKKKK